MILSRKQVRTDVLAALNAHPYFTTHSVRAVDLDGSPEAIVAYEGDLRDQQTGAVLCLTQVLSGKLKQEANRFRRVERSIEFAVLVRVNPENASAPDHDQVVDEVVKCVSGLNTGPGAKRIEYVDEQLLNQSPGIHSTSVRFTTTIITEGA